MMESKLLRRGNWLKDRRRMMKIICQ